MSHPYGVQPEGNRFLNSGCDDCRDRGLGTLARLPDSFLIDHLLEDSYLGPVCLCRLSRVSRVFYVYCHVESIWRWQYMRTFPASFQAILEEATLTSTLCWKSLVTRVPHVALRMRGVYSDYLFHPWLCATCGVADHLEGRTVTPHPIPKAAMDPATFLREYESKGRPCVLQGVIQANWQHLLEKFETFSQVGETLGQNRRVQCEAMCVTWPEYYAYLNHRELHSERPLYLFDPEALRDLNLSLPYFPHDFFSVLGKDTRPQYRWLVVGPERSGSSFHIDPNATNAWNALFSGKKWWLMLPPGVTPPGVKPSADGGDVTTSPSLMEWVMNWYPAALRTGHCYETVCEAGEIMYIPSGWWHMVINLTDCIALTQNYVGPSNVAKVLRFLRHKKRAITGCGGMDDDELDGQDVIARRGELFDVFSTKLIKAFPGKYEELVEQVKGSVSCELDGSIAPVQKKRKGLRASEPFTLF